MSYIDGSSKTFTSTNDLSTTGQFLAVKMDSTANQVVLASASTDKIIGIMMSAPKALDIGEVRLRSASGTIEMFAGGTIAVGDAVTANSSGQGVTTTSSGDQIIGYALYAASSGNLVELMPSTAKV